MRAIAAILLLLAGLLAAPTVAAQTCTASAPDIYFGNVNTPVPQVDVAAPMTINCTGGNANATVRICVGIEPSNWFFGTRRMFQGIFSSLPYAIYSNAAGTQSWTDNPLVLVQVPLNAGGSGSTTATMYARMPAGGSPPAGAYNSAYTDDNIIGVIKPGNSGCNSGSSTGTFNGGPFNVHVFISGSCTITADALLDFGNVMGGTMPQRDSTLALHATCNNQLPYTIALNAGQVSGGTIAQRKLGLNGTGPGVVNYNLYHDAARSQLWGDGSTGTVHNGTGNGAIQDITVYGRVPAGQAMPAGGTYRDTVTATITF
jgi:spore coat protein U-like protein